MSRIPNPSIGAMASGVFLLTTACGTSPQPQPQADARPSHTRAKSIYTESLPPQAPAKSSPPIDPAVEALHEAADAWVHQVGGNRFAAAIQSAAPVFAEVPVTVAGEQARWKRVTMNRHRAGLDAIRFHSPVSGPTELFWSIAASNRLAIMVCGLTTSQEKMSVSDPLFTRHGLAINQIDLPATNFVCWQRIASVKLEPDTEYYLFFRLYCNTPGDAYFRLKCFPAESPAAAETLHEIAEALDFDLPFRFTPASTLVERIWDVAEYSGCHQASDRLKEEALHGAPTRTLEFLRAWLIYRRGMEQLKAGQVDKADPLFLEAAANLRELHSRYFGLNGLELEMFSWPLYQEARVHARAGRLEAAIDTLVEAFGRRHVDATRLLNEPDFASLQDVPRFRAFLAQRFSVLPDSAKDRRESASDCGNGGTDQRDDRPNASLE